MMRLNKYIARSGICSRRDADALIRKGLVTVNGQPVREMGHKVSETDEVHCKGQLITPEEKRYLLMNKPAGYLCTVSDDRSRKTVMDLIRDDIQAAARLYPVGRLDKDTCGLLLLTNDGELAQRLAHPSFEVEKLYHVEVDKPVETKDLKVLQQGIRLEDGAVRPDSVAYVRNKDKRQLGVTMHSGRKRIVRRMFAHIGYKVVHLDRTCYAGLTKKNLPRGKWRYLTASEVNMLKAYGRVG